MRYQRVVEHCATCNGSGVVSKDYLFFSRESTCPDCNGRGVLSEKRIYTYEE